MKTICKITALLAVITMLMMVFLLSTKFYASETKTVVKELTSEDRNPKYEFDETLKDGDKEYRLNDVKYDLIQSEDKTEKQDKTTKVVKQKLVSKKYSLDKNADYFKTTVTVDGKEYQGTLIDVKYKDQTLTGRTGEVSGGKTYGVRTSAPTPPSTMPLLSLRRLSKQRIDASGI